MPQLNKNRLSRLLDGMLKHVVDSPVFTSEPRLRFRLFPGDDMSMAIVSRDQQPVVLRKAGDEGQLGRTFYLIDSGLDNFDDYILEITHDADLGPKVSPSAVEGSVERLLRRFVNNPEPLEQDRSNAIRDELKRLRATVKSFRAFVPIDGLELAGINELRIGRILLRPTPSAVIRIRECTSKSQADPKQDQINFLLDHVLPSLEMASVCAEVTASAGAGRLSDVINSEVDASLNLLRCFTHELFSKQVRVTIGLRGTVTYAARPCVAFDESGTATVEFQTIGALRPFELTADALGHLRQHFAFDELEAVLLKPDAERTAMEANIRTAVRWIGRSFVSPGTSERILSLATGLERLLVDRGEGMGDIGDKIAERVALLLVEDADAAMTLKARVKQLYRIRSDVVHAGRTDVSEEDFDDLESITLSTLISMARRTSQWATPRDFVDWVHRRPFSKH